jgi:hypothetical protein
MKNKKSDNSTLLHRIKSILANHDLSQIKDGFMTDITDRHYAERIGLTTPASTWTTMMDLMAHYWGYIDGSINQVQHFQEKFIFFIESLEKKSILLREIVKAYENKLAQDDFFENNKQRTFHLHNGKVQLINLKSKKSIDVSDELLSIIYRSSSFKHKEHYLNVEKESIKTLKEASEIIGENWSFLLILDSIDTEVDGRNLGRVPVLQIATTKMDGGFMYDEETNMAVIGLPLTFNRLFEVVNNLGSESNEVYHVPQLQHIKQMLASHFMKEELEKTLPNKEANQPAIKRAAVKI